MRTYAKVIAYGLGFLMLEKFARDSGALDMGSGSIVDNAIWSARNALTPDGRADEYLPAIQDAERRHGIPSGLLYRLLYKESRFRDDIITGATRSPVGALGIAQFMPATAAEMGIDPLDPWQSIDAAAKYLARLKRALGTWEKAVAAYNWGIGNVSRKGMDRAPKETRDYVAFIITEGGYTNA